MSPQRPDLVLTADIPDGKLNVLVLDGFDVEAFEAGWCQCCVLSNKEWGRAVNVH